MAFHHSAARAAAAALLSGAAIPVHADVAATVAQPVPGQGQEIIVTAPQLFRDVRPERTLDEAGIASYGVSTVDELLGEVQGELGDDDDPVLLVNGQRIHDLDEIGTFPVEVLRQVQVLPRGSATRVGGSPGQRVVSLTLHNQLRSATVTLAPRVATEGGWHATRGEAILTSIHGQTRANLSLRVSDESALLETDRDIIQPPPRLPYAAGGNVIAYPDLLGEVDPHLTDAAGTIVTSAPVPLGANPSLADFAAGANRPAVTDLGDFRTLRPRSRTYETAASYNRRLAPWLTASATARLGRSETASRLGLAPGLFLLSPDNPFSPFSNSVALAFYRPADPLRYRSSRDSGDAGITFNALFGRWQASLNARFAERSDHSTTERAATSDPILLADDENPFAGGIAGRIGITTGRARFRSTNSSAQLTLTGPALALPAGDLLTTFDVAAEQSAVRSRSDLSVNGLGDHFRRSQQSVHVAVEVPLTSRDHHVLGGLGEIQATAEYRHAHVSDAGGLSFRSAGLNWDPVPTVHLRGSIEKSSEAAPFDLIGSPVILSPDVRIFDVLTGETVDVEQLYGGNPSLLPQTTRTRRLSGLWRVLPRSGFQVNAEYDDTDTRNFVSSLPAASAAVVLAFPDRFIRNSSGTLVRVDLRPVNFAGHRQKRLRYGFSLNAPLGGGNATPSPGHPFRPAARLQLTANHSITLHDTILIRDGLDPVDLLGGGAIGIGGGRVRHQVDATAALTSGGMGIRLGGSWRGPSLLDSRIDGVTGRLHFEPLLVLNLKAFADVQRLLPHSPWAKGARLAINVVNLAGKRQRVIDSAGNTPLQYQPDYRDPIGRTVEIELRKVF